MDCPQADGDKPAGDWATSHDSVHDVLVNKKCSAMLVFILFSTEENHVSFLCSCFAKVPPSHFTEFKDVPSFCICPFRVLVPGVSLQLSMSLHSMFLWWCCFFHESLMMQHTKSNRTHSCCFFPRESGAPYKPQTYLWQTIVMHNNTCFIGVYLYYVGTQHGNVHQSSVTRSRVTSFILRADTETCVSNS